MTKIIAVAGKGGVGKTTVAALLVAACIRRGMTPVLAVDADPNPCLDAALGVVAAATIGRLREEARDAATTAGLSKREFLELKIAESLVEAERFDLIAMGRPEGPGCYCYANALLKDIMAEVAHNYPYLVVDNEAGLENLSRRLVPRADLLVLVSDPSSRGLATVAGIADLAREMGIAVGKTALVVNRLREGRVPTMVAALSARARADRTVLLPDDPVVAGCGEEGKSLLDLPPDNPAAAGVTEILEDVLP